MPFTFREQQRQQQPQRTTLHLRDEQSSQSSMSLSVSTNHDQRISITDEDSVQVSSDGESPSRNGFPHQTESDFPDVDVLPPMSNVWQDILQHEDSDFPDVEILPPFGSNNSGWMESSVDHHQDSDSDFPDVESLPTMNFSVPPPSAMSLLLTQNDREDMRLQSKQRAIEDISRNFRCHRPQCEIDESTIVNPRLRRQQAYSGQENVVLLCTKCGNPENYTLYY